MNRTNAYELIYNLVEDDERISDDVILSKLILELRVGGYKPEPALLSPKNNVVHADFKKKTWVGTSSSKVLRGS